MSAFFICLAMQDKLYFALQSYIAYGSYIGFASYIALYVRSCGGKNYALCLFGEFSYKHLLFRRRNARSSGDEEGSAEHQILYEVAGALCFFLHQRNEWHNEATPLNVREP